MQAKSTRSRLIKALSLCAAAVLGAEVCAQTAPVALRHIGGWISSDFESAVVEKLLLANINEAGKGSRLSVRRVGGPEVVPAEQQLGPLIAGAFDTIYTSPGYFSEYTVLGTIPALLPESATIAIREACGFEEALRRPFLEKAKVAYIGSLEKGSSDRLYLRNTELKGADLTGLRLRASASQIGAIRALGGAPTNLPYGEVYTALDKGVIDGAVSGGDWSSARDAKWHEIIKYAVDLSLTYTRTPVLINAGVWNKLSDAQKKALRDGVDKSSRELPEIISADARKAKDEMTKRGVTFIKLPADLERQIVKTYQQEQMAFIVKNEPVFGPPIMKAVECIWTKI